MMIKLWRAHRAERQAQREYLQSLGRSDVSRLDVFDWTPERIDRLAREVCGPDASDRQAAGADFQTKGDAR